MSREKRTRPSVGALGRAVETGSAMQADTTSKPQFTPNGPGGQRKVADLLSHGRENAIPRRELERLTGLDGRTVRLMIERERREGRPILADNATGYYLPATEHERAACVRSMRHRAGEIMKSAQAIEHFHVKLGCTLCYIDRIKPFHSGVKFQIEKLNIFAQ